MENLTELHLHLDGSLRPQTVWELMHEQGKPINAKDVKELTGQMMVPEEGTTLVDYLDKFDLPLSVLQQADALERVTYELIEDLAREGLTYAEIRFAPQSSTKEGLSQDEAVEAAVRGVKRAAVTCPMIRAGLILCCMRGDGNEDQNMETIETARKYLGDVVCAVDLAGAESLFPTENFAPVFFKAKEYGIPMTIHAGEGAGPESIRAALSFGTKRIGHGVRAVEDPELVEQLADEKITLEVCPTSNVHTQTIGCERMEDHPIRKLYDAGVHVTVNSDNRTVSGITLAHELKVLQEKCGFTETELRQMEEYAEEARFL